MRKKYIDSIIDKIDIYNYSSIKELLCNYNIKIIERSIKELGDINSISINNNVFINNELDPIQENFILLHELGHIFLHESKANCFNPISYQSREEREANYFAIKLLMRRENVDLEEVAYLGVPVGELQRLADMGMIEKF